MNGMKLECIFGCDCCCCVRETLPESACLAQASQARLGEICRDS